MDMKRGCRELGSESIKTNKASFLKNQIESLIFIVARTRTRKAVIRLFPALRKL